MRVIKALILSLPTVGLTLGGVGAFVALNTISAPMVYAAGKQVGAKVGKPLKEALDLAKAKNFKGAMAKLEEAKAVPGKSSYEEYKINEIITFVAFNLSDTATAAKAIEAMIDSPESSPETRKGQLDQLIKLQYSTKNYDKAIQYGTRYLKDVGPDTEIALLVAQAYYVTKVYPQAVTAMQTTLKIAEQAGKPVKKEWLDLLRSSQQLAGRDDDAAATLGILLAQYPSPEYWRDAFIIEQNKGRGSDRKTLEMLRLKMVTGVLKDSDYIEMAEMAFALGFPGDAKMILERAIANKVAGAGSDADRVNRLLAKAQADSAADIKGLSGYEKESMAKPTGDADVKLGQAYLSYGEYEKGIEAIKRGLKKGGLKAEDEAHLMLGVAYFNSKKTADAITQFKAVPADSKLAGVARLWLVYANSKS